MSTEARTRERRTQAERTTETRQRLLDAAVGGLIERGYSGTTTIDVVDRSSSSRGALLYHFPTRNDLVVAALAHLAAKQADELRCKASEVPAGPGREKALIDLIWESYCSPLFFAALELWVAARTDPDLMAALLPAERALGRSLRDMIDDVWGEIPPGFDDAFGATLAFMRGLAVTSILREKRTREDQLVDVWKDCFTYLLERSATQNGKKRSKAAGTFR
jgi:AcrR family transcriptional regulator